MTFTVDSYFYIIIQSFSFKKSEHQLTIKQVQKRLHYLNRPNSNKLILIDAFQKDNTDKYRNLLSKIKAMDESVLLLQRQYDDTKLKAETEKETFLKTRSERLAPVPTVDEKQLINNQKYDANQFLSF